MLWSVIACIVFVPEKFILQIREDDTCQLLISLHMFFINRKKPQQTKPKKKKELLELHNMTY